MDRCSLCAFHPWQWFIKFQNGYWSTKPKCRCQEVIFLSVLILPVLTRCSYLSLAINFNQCIPGYWPFVFPRCKWSTKTLGHRCFILIDAFHILPQFLKIILFPIVYMYSDHLIRFLLGLHLLDFDSLFWVYIC